MKKTLLMLLLSGMAFTASAQYEGLAVAGAMAGINALKARPQKPDEYVTQATYQGQQFAQKRTPTAKLLGKGGAQIAALEQLLAARYAALLADNSSLLLGSVQEASFQVAQSQLATIRPTWSLTAYAEEMNFYRREDGRRQQAQNELARRQQQVRQARDQARRDSLAQVVERHNWQADSVRQALAAAEAAASRVEEAAEPAPLFTTTSSVTKSSSSRHSSHSSGRHTGPRIPRSAHEYIRGPRGGCFYYSPSGGKVYVDRSICN